MSTLKVNAFQDTSGKGFYPARAWISFNGYGTVAIEDDDGISSITDASTGTYNVNFDNAFGSAKGYSSTSGSGFSSGAYASGYRQNSCPWGTKTTTTCDIRVATAGGNSTGYDAGNVSMTCTS